MDAYDSFLKQQSALDKYVEGEIAKGKAKGLKGRTFSYTTFSGKRMATDDVNVLKENIESLRAKGASAQAITDAEYAYKAALKQTKIDYIDSSGDTAIDPFLSEMNYIKNSNSQYEGFSGMPDITSGADWDSSKGNIIGHKNKSHASTDYRKAQINKKMDAKK